MTTVNCVDTYIVPTTANEVTSPSQPAFSAYLGTTDSDVTGDSTIFLIGDTDIGTAMTEIFDQNNDFNTGSSAGALFTAPVTGRYILIATVGTGDTGACSYLLPELRTSNRRFYQSDNNPTPTVNTSDESFTRITALAEMDAADTAWFMTRGDNTTKTLDVLGQAGTNLTTYFMGYLQV